MIYIVTSGECSDYGIDAVFQDRRKAESYCECHPDAEIEEWEFFDNNIYTLFNVVNIYMDILENNGKRIYFKFQTLSKEDANYYMVNNDSVTVRSGNNIGIHLIRMLPKNYDKEDIKNKYTKVFYDLISEIRYLVSDTGLSSDVMKTTYDQRQYVAQLVKDFILGKFGIETESV